MATITVARTIHRPVAEVWTSWDDFGNIDKFNPNIDKSFLLANAETGQGATRQCNLDAKNHIQERIVSYVPEKSLRIHIYDGTLPMKEAYATFDFQAVGPNRTEVTMTMDFTPKFGLLGRLLMVPMMKPQLRKMCGKLLDGNKAYVEDGVVIARAA